MGKSRPHNNNKGDRFNHVSLGEMSRIQQFITEMEACCSKQNKSAVNYAHAAPEAWGLLRVPQLC